MKYVFIGDIHGKVEIVEKALMREGRKVFVGDFMDSYDRTADDHKKCLELVFSAIKKDPENHYFILGNHELSYMFPHMRCSGHTKWGAVIFDEFREEFKKLTLPYLFIDPTFLISHAGMSAYWFNQICKGDLSHLHEALENAVDDRADTWLYAIGQARGGREIQGGIFWCDFKHEFEPIKGLTQVFGHTRGLKIRNTGDNWCIDCLDIVPNFLEMEV